MANEDLIRGGTASVTAGQLIVTGQGVSWANVLEGDFFGAHVGLAVPIAAIVGNVITLMYAWTGPTQVAAAYAIQPKGDATRWEGRIRALVEGLANGTLAALTVAGSGANKLAYYTGAGVAALADLSPFARSNILSRANRSALLASGTGIGISENLASLSVYAGDLNTVTIGGWAAGVVGGTLNMPPNANYVIVHTLPCVVSPACRQIAYQYEGRQRWSRECSSAGVWTAWVSQASGILGTVSQFAGAPTGDIIEKGANALGNYTRLADGTQITWGTLVVNEPVAAGGWSPGDCEPASRLHDATLHLWSHLLFYRRQCDRKRDLRVPFLTVWV